MAIIKKILALVVTLSLLVSTLAEDEQQQRCEQQFRSQQQLKPCQEYLRDSTQVETEWRQQFQQCCQLLDRIDEQCRCEGIREIVQERQQQQQTRGEELREMMKTAESLPGLCRMGPQCCDITAQRSQAVSC